MTFASLSRSAALMLLCSLLTACGLTQAVSDGTVSATRAIFYKKIKVLRLDFEPRAAVETILFRVWFFRNQKSGKTVHFHPKNADEKGDNGEKA